MIATQLLIAANIAVYLLQTMRADGLLVEYALWPLGAGRGGAGFHPWQLATSAFLHGGTAHLALNMLALWMFGGPVEQRVGTARFVRLYAAAVLAAGLLQLAIVSLSSGPAYPTVGASGGVFGLLLAFGVLFPERTVMLLFPPIPMPARLFVVLYGALELLHGVLGTSAGVAHFAHLGGMLGAWIVLRRWRRRTSRRE